LKPAATPPVFYFPENMIYNEYGSWDIDWFMALNHNKNQAVQWLRKGS